MGRSAGFAPTTVDVWSRCFLLLVNMDISANQCYDNNIMARHLETSSSHYLPNLQQLRAARAARRSGRSGRHVTPRKGSGRHVAHQEGLGTKSVEVFTVAEQAVEHLNVIRASLGAAALGAHASLRRGVEAVGSGYRAVRSAMRRTGEAVDAAIYSDATLHTMQRLAVLGTAAVIGSGGYLAYGSLFSAPEKPATPVANDFVLVGDTGNKEAATMQPELAAAFGQLAEEIADNSSDATLAWPLHADEGRGHRGYKYAFYDENGRLVEADVAYGYPQNPSYRLLRVSIVESNGKKTLAIEATDNGRIESSLPAGQTTTEIDRAIRMIDGSAS
jgi:hypothetical protein